MTTAQESASPSTTGSDVVTALLDAIEAGRVRGCRAYAADAELDATVPNWRFSRRGAAAILAVYEEWFAHPGRFETLRRLPIDGGEVVEYVLTWAEQGVPHAAHHLHVFELDDDANLVVRDTVMCGGRWPASLLAEMEASRG